MLAGLSYVLCFPRFDSPIFSLLVMPFLLFCVHALDSRKQAATLGFLLSAIVAWGGFHWIIYVAQNFGGMPIPIAVGLLCLFCLVAAPHMVAFNLLGFSLRGSVERLPLFLRPLFWASLFTGLEYLARFTKIFPEHLGNTLVSYLSIAQAASLGGVSLLTFLPLWLGASVFYARKNGVRALPSVGAALLLPIALHLWGNHELARVRAEPTETMRIGLVQHNMDDAEKAFAQVPAREVVAILVGKLLEKTRALAEEKPDLILWPETAYPMNFTPGPAQSSLASFGIGYANLVKSSVAQNGIPLLFGGYEKESGLTYNSGILLGAGGEKEASYHKQVLLIFGEYFPGDKWFPSLKSINPLMGDFGRGPGPTPVPFSWRGQPFPLGVNICYEAILPEYMRGYALSGARLFVNLTKDSWFGNTFEPWQHLQLSVLRSIEHRIPMVRATNTGLSGVVRASGETQILSAPFEEAYRVVEVPLLKSWQPTLYTRLGEWFAWLTLLVAAALAFFARRIA
jgi:apolipoprotein N-acyltransferase